MSPPDYSGLPYEVITEVNENDIVCGRKGLALKHSGNISYRKIVALNKEGYGKFEDECVCIECWHTMLIYKRGKESVYSIICNLDVE